MSGEKEKSNLDEPLTNSSQNSTSLLSANPNLTNDNPENNEVAENAVPTTAANHHPETDHNSNHPKAIVKPNNDKDLREGEFSDLSADQLLAELLKARERIAELEASLQAVPPCPKNPVDDIFDEMSVSEESLFFETVLSAMDKLETEISEPTETFKTKSLVPVSTVSGPQSPFQHEDFIIAYQHKGDFPPCDQDLFIDSTDQDNESRGIDLRNIIFDESVWENCSDTDVSEGNCEKIEKEDFPLIPSPVINTPPYEYIFLTKENEAKFRIFLNPKLNQVFQEELLKLQREEEYIAMISEQDPDYNSYIQLHTKTANESQNNDTQNQKQSTSTITASSNVTEAKSANAIHCFDPSDVDLELKRIFTEKPPITHKIVRRKPREVRGSSVPAVDSYYGTSDLNKVGHASYFIPALTKSEQRAIGWKPEYHFGHWKYSALNVPDIRHNPISLHPHPHLSDENYKSHHSSRHHHHHHHNHYHRQSDLLAQNPLHQKEIDISNAFLIDSEANSLEVNVSKRMTSCKNKIHRMQDGSFSFLTFSGISNDPSAKSCHVIPNKCALKRLLKWILPSCLKQPESSTSGFSQNATNVSEITDSKLESMDAKIPHEIQTLVEPSSKLSFPASHTHFTFAAMRAGAPSNVDENDNKNSQYNGQDNPYCKSNTDKTKNSSNQPIQNDKVKSHNQRHSHHHQASRHVPKHLSHHHGIFRWKSFLHHHLNKSDDSMSVVGGDVLVMSDSKSILAKDDSNNENDIASNQGKSEVQANSVRSTVDDDKSYTEESETDPNCSSTAIREKRKLVKKTKKLKQCKAHERLVTLKDLGYETEKSDAEEEDSEKMGPRLKEINREHHILRRDQSGSSISRNSNVATNGSSTPAMKRKMTHSKIQGKKQSPRFNFCDFKANSSDCNASNDGDDDCGSTGSTFTPPSVSEEDWIETAQFDFGGSFSDTEDFLCTNCGGQVKSIVESRFLDPRDLELLHQKHENNHQLDTLPFVYEFGDEIPDSDTNSADYDYSMDGTTVLEWMDANFQQIEESLGLIYSCVDTATDSSPGSSEVNDVDKVDGQHRIVTLNDLEGEADIQNMNENLGAGPSIAEQN